MNISLAGGREDWQVQEAPNWAELKIPEVKALQSPVKLYDSLLNNASISAQTLW